MPIKEITTTPFVGPGHLTRELAAEWAQPASSNSEPLIVIERDALRRPVRVYVVWSKWRNTPADQRSEIIMDAAETVLPQNELLSITVAMGVLPEEAAKLGLVSDGHIFNVLAATKPSRSSKHKS